jgi:hypothetical protein
VRSGNVMHPIGRCKTRSSDPTENCVDVPPFPRSVPPSPADRARRLAELREVLAHAAPAFRSRIDAAGRGDRP